MLPTCFAQCKKEAAKQHKKNRTAIMHDINLMHLAPSAHIFNGMAALFLKKWAKEEQQFCNYFKETWLGSRQNWFESASIYTPSHITTTLKVPIKRDVTMRARLPMAEFTEAVLDMTRKISQNYAQNLRSIATEPNMPLALWRNGASWAQSDTPQNVIERCSDEIVVQVISTKGMQSGVTFEKINELNKKKWSNFDQFVAGALHTFWNVHISIRDWKLKSKCDCPDFFKNYMCKHIIGVALREKLCKCPKNAIPTLLAQKAKPGRKKRQQRHC